MRVPAPVRLFASGEDSNTTWIGVALGTKDQDRRHRLVHRLLRDQCAQYSDDAAAPAREFVAHNFYRLGHLCESVLARGEPRFAAPSHSLVTEGLGLAA